MRFRQKIDYSITVTGGVGQATLFISWDISYIIIAKDSFSNPDQNVTYQAAITDDAGAVMFARDRLQGPNTFNQIIPCSWLGTFQITGASSDGTFVVRLYAK